MDSWLWSITVIIFITVHGRQLHASEGFISIDCGISSNANYSDSKTKLQYVSDDQFTDAGINYNISSDYSSYQPPIVYQNSSHYSLEDQLLTLRSFPDAPRSCYSLKPVIPNKKFLVRATFFYGNYDGKNSSNIKFDLHIDVNFWQTVNITDPANGCFLEAVVVSLGNSISVCLINTGSGTPFISALDLRPLQDDMYPAANTTQYLNYAFRVNVGPDIGSSLVRYPDDPYDRIWWPATEPNWVQISTAQMLSSPDDYAFHPPMIVMQTAAAPVNSSIMEFNWTFADTEAPNNEFYVNLFFAELQFSASRTFDVYLNGRFFHSAPQRYLFMSILYSASPLDASSEYLWALNSTGLSPLPPFINAVEGFTAMHLTQAATDSGDAVDAINAIKKHYQVKRNWMGDPCSPKQYSWDGLDCTYLTMLRITTLNMSSSALIGVMSPSFANLTKIKYLNLSYNNLTGPIPDALGTLSSLQVLDLTGNNLTGTVPDSLLKRSQGELTFRYDGNPYLCANGSCKSKKTGTAIIVIPCVVSVVLVLLLVVIFTVWRVTKSQGKCFLLHIQASKNNMLQLENRLFTYKQLEKITKKFTNLLGKGGFGNVFLGCLEDGTQVAVKMRSQSSSQGTKEFLAEAQNLTKIHHKNLVSLVGYCMDRDHLALVYEFLSRGTLQDHLRDKAGDVSVLSWEQRLHIAVDAAQGLEYLHRGCKPPLIHRDVKSSNILLGESLEAKIADFGLSRAFDQKRSHVSTTVVGTPGYLDPEYYSSFQVSEKSDVYGFGVVILELITGRPSIFVTDKQSASLVVWVRQRLASGYIEDIVDARLQRLQYDVNSIWKAADVALRCTELAVHKRPAMADVVLELKESLALEIGYRKSEIPSASNNSTYARGTEISHTNDTSSTSLLELEHISSFTPSFR
ncbi:senescence-induced receptor-like serine/threonine-protein kinase [Canna indica]|uniref:non-specific serine/threonine protein kinase n=1 Tax=Canna indica TaxID=4628 RepID=A0AAQ3PW23_9LILI|nr:senescence-induced receptor-like serine/threonine-protein kinase [Canna indica]